jgi:hypothetical protein
MCYSEIITNKFKLSENQIINIEKGTIKNFLRDSTDNYLCNSHDSSGSDLFFRRLWNWDNFQCGCGGGTYGMLSYNPIYIIKATASTYFKDKLDTADTAAITPVMIDTMFYKTCPTRLIICPIFANPCPMCDESWTMQPNYWTLGTTTAGNKYLIRFDSLYMEYDSLQHFWKDYSLVTFILQTDGSLNFSEAFESPITNQNFKSVKPKKVLNTISKKLLTNDIAFKNNYIYDIQGKRINNLKLQISKDQILRLVIISERNQSR